MTTNNYIKIQGQKVEAKFDVFIYSKDKIVFTYAPALDLMGYGKSLEEAKQSFLVVVEDFISFGLQRKTLTRDLEEHGWVKHHQTFEVPDIINVLSNNEEAREIMNNDYNKSTFPFSSQLAFC